MPSADFAPWLTTAGLGSAGPTRILVFAGGLMPAALLASGVLLQLMARGVVALAAALVLVPFFLARDYGWRAIGLHLLPGALLIAALFGLGVMPLPGATHRARP